uniref:Uncharacterized protein n=1 Tax=Picea sitchensis TaxID=3332 RepID=A9NMC8_PICSI|nr:unknown [Picea sitchensis]ABK24108.1 unknown [Picea sitchensis]
MILVALLVRLMEDFAYIMSGLVSRLVHVAPMPMQARRSLLRWLQLVRMQHRMR